MKSAILIHCLDWAADGSEFNLGQGVSLCRTNGSDVERLYHQVCETQNVDEGDPFSYDAHVLLTEEALDDSYPYWGGPFSIISRCCNFIALCTSSSLGMCRLLTSKDDFNTSWTPSMIIYEDHPDAEILRAYPDFLSMAADGTITTTNERFPVLDDSTLQIIARCWDTYHTLRLSNNIDNHRIANALSYFFYSWRSYYMDHVCLNLAILLETLFSPSSTQELSHQISFNVSRFYENTGEKQEALYKKVKRFYAVRSQIVHGGQAKDKGLYTLTPEMFHLCSQILIHILSNTDVATRFCHEKERTRLLSEWMFG